MDLTALTDAVKNGRRPEAVKQTRLALDAGVPAMKTTVDALRGAGLPNLKIVVGGAPVPEDFAREIGADGYSRDAARAVELVHGLLPRTSP